MQPSSRRRRVRTRFARRRGGSPAPLCVAAAVAAGCGGGGDAVGPAEVREVRYTLISAVDLPLPVFRPDTNGVRPELHGGTLALRSDSTAAVAWHYRRVRLATGVATHDTVRASGTYAALRTAAGRVDLAFRLLGDPDLDGAVADVRGDSLVFGLFTFRR